MILFGPFVFFGLYEKQSVKFHLSTTQETEEGGYILHQCFPPPL